MSRFTSKTAFQLLPDGKTWVVDKPFGYAVGDKNSTDIINVPLGFKTDFASVPRIFWFFIPRYGVYTNAAVIHDFLYWEQERSRLEADNIFREGMGVLKTPWFTKMCMYRGVRIGGRKAWLENQVKKVNGESKIHKEAVCQK